MRRVPTSSGRGAPWRRHAPPLALSAGIAGLLAAWVFTLPPGAAPDEREHYVKAVGAGALELAGSRRPPSAAQERAFLALIRSVSHRPGISVRERSSLDWSVRNTRTFTVPARLIPHFDCGAWQRHEQHFL